MLFLTACTHLGPKTIPVDRFDYGTAIADSWKQQLLLNIVKLRYLDLPVFVDVSSIVSGYSLQTGVNVGGTLSSNKASGISHRLADKLFTPTGPRSLPHTLTGEKFLRGLITPIDPRTSSSLQSGYAADFIRSDRRAAERRP